MKIFIQAGQEAEHCSHPDTSPGSGVTRTGRCQGQLGASPATPPQRTPARPPSRAPLGLPARRSSGSRGPRPPRRRLLSPPRPRSPSRSRRRPGSPGRPQPLGSRTPSAPTPGPPPTHPGLHLPSSAARGALATPGPRTGAPPRGPGPLGASRPDRESSCPRACAASARPARLGEAPLLRVFEKARRGGTPTNRSEGVDPEPERGRGSRREAGGDF